MTISQRVSIVLLLALGMSSHAVARTGSLTLADVQDKAHAAWMAANAKSHARQLRSLQSFSDACSSMQDTFQQAGFTCTCGTETLTCQLPSYCTDDDANAVCADFVLAITYNSDMTMGSVSVCVKYTSDPTGENRDVCVSLSYSADFTSIESCTVQIEDASGSMTNCNKCDPCTDGASLDIDCSNILPEATTNGCAAFALSGGDSTQSTLQNLGGGSGGATAGNSTTSNGGGTITGNSTSGGGGSGNGGSTGGSTSSGVSHGARAAIVLSGAALALIM